MGTVTMFVLHGIVFRDCLTVYLHVPSAICEVSTVHEKPGCVFKRKPEVTS